MNSTEESNVNRQTEFSGMFWGDFLEVCIPLNKQYYELFGYVPDVREYECTRQEFIEALERAVESQTEISEYLKKAPPADFEDGVRY